MKYLPYVALACLALAVAGLAYIRLAKSDVTVWHVDPRRVQPGPDPNQFLVRDGDGDLASPVFDIAAPDLAQAFDDVALSRPRVRRLAGGPGRLWTTYIQRSKWMGYPDYISVRAVPAGDGTSALVIYSRARFGRSDLGVNKARVTRWLAALHATATVDPKLAAE